MKEHAKLTIVLVAGYTPEDRRRIEAAASAAQWSQAVRFVENRGELFDYLYPAAKSPIPGSAPSTGLILLNIEAFGDDGQKILADIKTNPKLRRIPVLVQSTSTDKEDVLQFYQNGISGYIPLPETVEKWVEVMASVKKYWFETVILPAGIRG